MKKFILAITAICSLVVTACGPQLSDVRILPAPPTGTVPSKCYPTMEKIYDSDEKMFLSDTWFRGGGADTHRVEWKFARGDSVRPVHDRYERIESHSRFSYPILLSEKVRKELPYGIYDAQLFLDGRLLASRKVEFVNQSIGNTAVKGAVVLPFSYDEFSYVRSDEYLHVVSDAIYGQVNRIFKKTVPPVAAFEKLDGQMVDFGQEEQRRTLLQKFDEDVFITGVLKLPRFTSEEQSLVVHIYNKKTGNVKKFVSVTYGGKRYYADEIEQNIKNLLFEQGVMAYLQTLD